jgi:hypothetical protein
LCRSHGGCFIELCSSEAGGGRLGRAGCRGAWRSHQHTRLKFRIVSQGLRPPCVHAVRSACVCAQSRRLWPDGRSRAGRVELCWAPYGRLRIRWTLILACSEPRGHRDAVGASDVRTDGTGRSRTDQQLASPRPSHVATIVASRASLSDPLCKRPASAGRQRGAKCAVSLPPQEQAVTCQAPWCIRLRSAPPPPPDRRGDSQ